MPACNVYTDFSIKMLCARSAYIRMVGSSYEAGGAAQFRANSALMGRALQIKSFLDPQASVEDVGHHHKVIPGPKN